MIQSLNISNFRSIKDVNLPLKFSEGKAPNGYKESENWSFIQVAQGVKARICPVLALYGANASGKTTLLLALRTLTKAIKEGWDEELYQPNLISAPQGADNDSVFSIEFWINKHLYRYQLGISKRGFSSESLYVDDNELYRIESSVIRSLSGFVNQNHSDLLSSFQLRCVNAKTHCQVQTFLTEIATAFPGISRDLLEARDYLKYQIITIRGEVPFVVGIKLLAKTFETGADDEKEQKAIDMILGYLHRLDIPIVGMRLEEGSTSDVLKSIPDEQLVRNLEQQGTFYTLQTAHKSQSGKEVWLNISKESEGTRRLIGLLGYLLASIKMGKTVCIDEIDDSLHSLLVIELIDFLKQSVLIPIALN